MREEDAGGLSSACVICGGSDGAGEDGPSSSSTSDAPSPSSPPPPSFALRCNSCSLWYHPWCLGYQLDLDRSCLITAAEVDIDIDATTGLPLVCQWFCDSCASTVTGVVAATAKKSRSRSSTVRGSGSSRTNQEQTASNTSPEIRG